MTLEEAIELRKTIDQSKPKPEPKFELKPAVRKSYSSGLYNPKYSTPQWQPLEQIGKKKVYPQYYRYRPRLPADRHTWKESKYFSDPRSKQNIAVFQRFL